MLPALIPYPEIDPALFTIAIGDFEFSLRWYALAYIFGIVVGWRLVLWLMRRPGLWPAGRAPMTAEQVEELLTWMVIGVVLGGRIGYVLFYDFPRFMAEPLEIFKVWAGGMSFHGGFLGVILATIVYSRIRAIPVLQVGDAMALAAPTGLLFGRLANFINGELYGRVTDVAWAMRFPIERGPDGEVISWTEPRHPSQLYEAALEGVVLFAVLWWLAFARGWLKRPGAIIGVFFIGYGAARFLVEFVRQWDAQLAEFVATWGITMGQVLSLPMIAIGAAFLAIAFRRRTA